MSWGWWNPERSRVQGRTPGGSEGQACSAALALAVEHRLAASPDGDAPSRKLGLRASEDGPRQLHACRTAEHAFDVLVSKLPQFDPVRQFVSVLRAVDTGSC